MRQQRHISFLTLVVLALLPMCLMSEEVGEGSSPGQEKLLTAQVAQPLMDAAQKMLTPPYPDFLASWQDVQNPFCAFIAPPPPPPTPQIAPSVPPAVQQNSEDLQILRTIIPYLKPTGIFKRDKDTCLLFNGNVVKEGGTMRIKYGGAFLTLRFNNISEEGFTVSLREASQTVILSSASQIKR